MRLYAAKIEDYQYKSELVDVEDGELLEGLGLVMIDPTHAWITERGVWVWESWCASRDPLWHRPPVRLREFSPHIKKPWGKKKNRSA